MAEDRGIEAVVDKAKSSNGASRSTPPFSVPTATSPRSVPRRAPQDHPYLFFNRELSWLDFNWRVFHQAVDERTPLLERVRFLGITASNLDEFFRKRVGGLKRQLAAGVRALSPDGRTPEEQLELILKAVQPMYRMLTDMWEQELRPLLRQEAGIFVVDFVDLDEHEKQRLYEYFQANIFPILTPLAVDPGHPFPFISNQSLSLAIGLRHPTRRTVHFARLKVPTSRGRWLPLSDPLHFVPVEQVIANNLGELFRGMDITSVSAFRITRNADMRRDEEEADDLLEMISEELRERRFAPVVRLEVQHKMPEEVRELLVRELSLKPEDIFENHGLIDHADCTFFANLDIPRLRFEPWEPIIPTRLIREVEGKDRPSIFEVIREADLLVHHPYESFRASVQRFVEEAAVDPDVLAIKQTLYRTSDESPIVRSLMRAAERGKQVAVLVEVKARFDEESNIEWGQMLEKAGVHVTYGLVGLKTHTKTTLVIREEADGIRTYCHIGTGNYNEDTARLYTDLGLFTADAEIGMDVINLFHYLTGYAPEQHYRKLIVAPRDMRNNFLDLIREEVRLHGEHGDGRIIAKMNAIDDVEIIRELYSASQAGVRVDLIVRGHCRIRPGLSHHSENINVISILGRFLEHSRIYYFHTHGRPRLFIGSADWQRRNLDDRVEAVVPVEDPTLQGRLIRTLQFALSDRRSAWDLLSDGHCVQRLPKDPSDEVGFQEMLMQRAMQRVVEVDAPWDL